MKKNDTKGILIPNEILDASNMGNRVKLKCYENIIVLKKEDMTGMEMLDTVQTLIDLAQDILDSAVDYYDFDFDDEEEDEETISGTLFLSDDILNSLGLSEDTIISFSSRIKDEEDT